MTPGKAPWGCMRPGKLRWRNSCICFTLPGVFCMRCTCARRQERSTCARRQSAAPVCDVKVRHQSAWHQGAATLVWSMRAREIKRAGGHVGALCPRALQPMQRIPGRLAVDYNGFGTGCRIFSMMRVCAQFSAGAVARRCAVLPRWCETQTLEVQEHCCTGLLVRGLRVGGPCLRVRAWTS